MKPSPTKLTGKLTDKINDTFVASRQGLGAIIASIFFTGIIVVVGSRTPRQLNVSTSTNISTRSASIASVVKNRGAQNSENPVVNANDEVREPASIPSHHLPFAAESSSTDLSPAAVKARTGVDAVRVRSALFFADTITQHNSSFTLRINLFPDAMLTAEFQAPSVLATNSHLYVGTISGDPDGQFRLNIDGERVSGTIQAFHRTYQLIPTLGASHLIAELKPRH